jgi:hypothetical protein
MQWKKVQIFDNWMFKVLLINKSQIDYQKDSVIRPNNKTSHIYKYIYTHIHSHIYIYVLRKKYKIVWRNQYI